MNAEEVKVIGFDADDTLWVNEQYFREGEEKFCRLMNKFSSDELTMKTLFNIEMQNLDLYGYGVKGFMLSMLESASLISKGKLDNALADEIISIGKGMLQKPVVLLDKVHEILKLLQPKYKLVLVTKGDLLDQERKLKKSGLEPFFHHIEIMSEKKSSDYLKLIAHLEISSKEFVMIGNSLKSDVLPVIEIGSKAIYVPHEITWQHEQIDINEEVKTRFNQVSNLGEVLNVLL